ncbi:MAG: hypothetical protein AVDCRST_MAG91-3438, partial [uncultured Sphingomonadaceae bacterium]
AGDGADKGSTRKRKQRGKRHERFRHRGCPHANPSHGFHARHACSKPAMARGRRGLPRQPRDREHEPHAQRSGVFRHAARRSRAARPRNADPPQAARSSRRRSGAADRAGRRGPL